MKTKTTRKLLTLAIALALTLALIPAIPVAVPANAVEVNPWTGRWSERDPLTGNPGEDFCFWQVGDTVVGTHGSYGIGRFQGKASGNKLTGAITNSYGTYSGAAFTMSADGSITGSYQFGTYERRTDLQLTKRLDYTEVTPEYSPGTDIAWTGLWHIGGSAYGATYMVQTGDTVTGFIGYNGYIKGTVSAKTLTAHFMDGQKVGSHITYVFTMSADGGSLSVYNYFGNSTSDTHTGERLSPITYVSGEMTSPPQDYNASGWALPEVLKAGELGLIPDSLANSDLRLPITRAEFTAVAVKLYENLTGITATPVSPNPFTDTSDTEVLKAYNIGVINGMTDTTFAPNERLTREQMATLLTRVLKVAYIPGWSLAVDAQRALVFDMPAPFADDALISDYARESVYFMFASGIVTGTGGNNFSPRTESTSEQAINTATATREQAIIIALHMVDLLKDRPLDYTQG